MLALATLYACRQKHQPTQARNLTALFEFVKTNRHEYVQPGRLTDAERDQIEQQVALSVRTCSANIERLERNVQLSRPQGLNETTCAHRLGVVCFWFFGG